jgi:hypothetical protein
VTPNIAVVHVYNPHWRSLRLWIPLFLLWIPAILLSPVIFLALLVLGLAGNVSSWRAVAICWAILCSLPGTEVNVCAQHKQVLVRIL